MSDFKVEFTLKQHTPMIHFQAKTKDEGATLRATELKPKFDKFLIEYFEKNNITYKDFLIPGEKKALNYKVRVEEVNESKPFIYESNFIGNMDDNAEKKNEKFSKGIIYLSFHSFYTPLILAIENNFSTFLLKENFGARTSKGFGSFYLFDNRNHTYIQPDFSKIDKVIYAFNTNRNTCISDIKLLNDFFRSGLNLPDPKDKSRSRVYVKSALFSYLQDKTNISYEKKQIKHFFTDLGVEEDSKATLARELFGLSVRQEWGKKYDGMIITKSHNSITRFKSPLIFRAFILDDIEAKPNAAMKVYFWADDSYKSILGKQFTVKSSNHSNNLLLRVPETFSFDDFFHYIATEYTFSVDRTYESQDEVKNLRKMIQEIKESSNG